MHFQHCKVVGIKVIEFGRESLSYSSYQHNHLPQCIERSYYLDTQRFCCSKRLGAAIVPGPGHALVLQTG
jgi:hypothetical protein